jgi:hypothetical protein
LELNLVAAGSACSRTLVDIDFASASDDIKLDLCTACRTTVAIVSAVQNCAGFIAFQNQFETVCSAFFASTTTSAPTLSPGVMPGEPFIPPTFIPRDENVGDACVIHTNETDCLADSQNQCQWNNNECFSLLQTEAPIVNPEHNGLDCLTANLVAAGSACGRFLMDLNFATMQTEDLLGLCNSCATVVSMVQLIDECPAFTAF